MSVCLSICLFVGVCVPVWFFVHMSQYAPIEQDLRGHVSYWIWRGLHIYVLVAIDWRQNANGHSKSSHVEVTSRMKFEKVISKADKKTCLQHPSWLLTSEGACLWMQSVGAAKIEEKTIKLLTMPSLEIRPQTSDLGPRTSGLRP